MKAAIQRGRRPDSSWTELEPEVKAASSRSRACVPARSYPNNVFGLFGAWTRQLVVVGPQAVAESTGVSPVPCAR
jgi:hypothetical protein